MHQQLIYVIIVGPLLQIVFDDRTAPTTISPAIFKQARAAYLALSPDELMADRVEPPPKKRKSKTVAEEQETPPVAVASAVFEHSRTQHDEWQL